MGKVEEYAELNSEKKRNDFYEQQKNNKMDYFENKNLVVDPEDMVDKFKSRIQDQTSFADRTKYYFEDYKLMESKVNKYRSIAADKASISRYALAHTNHSTRKRKRAANNAADNFEKASKLALEFDPEKTKGFALYEYREKIMRLRMKGMIEAAKLKSKSDNDEKYRSLKAKLSCLSILKDQMDVLRTDPDLTDAELVKYKNAKIKLDAEIQEAKDALHKQFNIRNMQWEREINVDDVTIKAKVLSRRKSNPYVTKENLKTSRILNCFLKEKQSHEYQDTFENMKRMQGCMMNMKNASSVDVVSAPCYTVKRNNRGEAFDDSEKKKEAWNKKWLTALNDNDSETKNKMLTECFQRYGRMGIPSPEELKDKGIMHFFKNDTASFFDLTRFAFNIENLKEADAFTADYLKANPAFEKKMRMARCLGTIFKDVLSGPDYMISEKSGYKIPREMDGYQHLGIKKSQERNQKVISETERKYSNLYKSMNDIVFKQKTDDRIKAEEHLDLVNDMKSILSERIGELKEVNNQKQKTTDPRLEELKNNVDSMLTMMEEKIPNSEEGHDQETFDHKCTTIIRHYNMIEQSVDKCLNNKGAYNSLQGGLSMLKKLKVQCRREREVFRNRAVRFKEEYDAGNIDLKDFDEEIENQSINGQERKPKWRDVLKYTRSLIYDLDKKGEGELEVSEGGSAQSDLLFIRAREHKDGMSEEEKLQYSLHGKGTKTKQMIFRADDIYKNEPVKNQILSILNSVEINCGGDKALQNSLRNDLTNALLKDLGLEKNVTAEIEKNARIELSNYIDASAFYNTMNDKFANDKRLLSRKPALPWKLMRSLFFDKKYEKYSDEISAIMCKFGKAALHRSIITDELKLKPGSVISDRHIATSRVAYMLGIDNMVCDSRSVYVRKNGKLIKGVAMEDSGGKDGKEIYNLAKTEGKQIKYSKDAISQIFTMQIFDILCGQLDRHFKNFHFQYRLEGDTYVLDQVKCIDNDISFGMRKASTKGYNRMVPFNEKYIMALPVKVLNNIMNSEMSVFGEVLGDLLDKDVLEAMEGRLNQIKQAVNKLVDRGELIKDETKKSYSYKNKDLQDDELRQLCVLRIMNESVEKNQIAKNISDLSYFDISILKGTTKDGNVGENIDKAIERRQIELDRIAKEKEKAEE